MNSENKHIRTEAIVLRNSRPESIQTRTQTNFNYIFEILVIQLKQSCVGQYSCVTMWYGFLQKTYLVNVKLIENKMIKSVSIKCRVKF